MTRPGLLRLITCIVATAAASSAAAAQSQAPVEVAFPLSIDNLPSYDRVNGLTVPFAPTITIGEDDRLVFTPSIAYRSHLGKVDPALSIVAQLTSDSTLGISLTGARGTFTNDDWIRPDLLNSIVSLGTGRDSRNYFRADRAEVRLTSTLHVPLDVATVFAGVRSERDWSTGWRGGSKVGPSSIAGQRDSVNGIQRPNPLINPGHLTSVIVGGHAEYNGVVASDMFDVRLELAGQSAVGGSFRQLTVNEATVIPTVLEHRLELSGHLVATSTNSFTPLQRYAYVGGAGSISTVDMLSRGGDHLYYVDALYAIPLSWITVPILGNAYVGPHFATGAAGVGGFGAPIQNIGVRLGVSVFTADLVLNPRTHKRDFGVGIALRP